MSVRSWSLQRASKRDSGRAGVLVRQERVRWMSDETNARSGMSTIHESGRRVYGDRRARVRRLVECRWESRQHGWRNTEYGER